MELKKNPEVDVNKLRGLFLNIGLVTTLLITIMAFQWNFSDGKINELTVVGIDEDEDEEALITEMLPPPPPKIQVPTIEIVEDDSEEEEEEVEIEEVEEETVVEEAVVEEVAEEEEEEIFMIVEQAAVPNGGMTAFRKHVLTYCGKNYPERAKKAGIAGTVFIYFFVDKDGSPKGFRILKGIGGGCDEVAMEAIKSYGNWTPPKQRGRPCKQGFNFPVKFRIQ